MIIDLQRFIVSEQGYWKELDLALKKIEEFPDRRMKTDEVRRFHYLYQRTSADLAQIATFAAEPETHGYLESLVARAYAEIHESRSKPTRFSPVVWFFHVLPSTFRRHIKAFWLSLAITVAGVVFGGMALTLDPEAKEVILNFPHLQGSPAERVAQEERVSDDRLRGVKITGASWYMTHNTKVSIFTMALGFTWGLGTMIMLFYNGIILGGVVLDYILAGQTRFLIAWLLPHGSIEIPAILVAGQAGLLLAGAMIGSGRGDTMKSRLRRVSGDLVTLCSGVAIMLVWAGFVEAFISQYHEPVLPYAFKIGFGLAELVLLVLFLGLAGRKAGLSGSHNETWRTR